MKIDIKNRYSGEVLFSHECKDNTIKITLGVAIKKNANLSDANLRNADLWNANLRNANLWNADLSDADLWNANLSDANLSDAVGNGIHIVSAQIAKYKIVFTAEFMWIGCRKHPIKTWWKDSEKGIEKFSESEIQWRKDNKRWINAFVKANPAKPTKEQS